MKSKALPALLVCVAVVAVVLAALGYQRQRERAALQVAVAGGDGGGLPLAQPEDEHLDGAALERASHDPAASGLAALIVMRHGHVVFRRFAHGFDADSVIDSGSFAPVLVALLAGVVVHDRALSLSKLGQFDPRGWATEIERASQHGYAELLSRRVWARINAGPAWIALPAVGAPVPTDCCFHARVQDWMRIGALLTDGGRFEGTQIVVPSWATGMRQPATRDGRYGLGVALPAAAHGAAPFAAEDVVFLRGPGHWRLWLSPSLHLIVLFGDVSGERSARASPDAAGGGAGAVDAWDETRLANRVIEAVADRTPTSGAESLLQQLVPHH